jgi:hypothetical protein
VKLDRLLLALLPFAFLLALADPPPPPQARIDQGVRDFVLGVLGAMLNLNDWIALFQASLRDFQSGAYSIGRGLIVLGLVWGLIRAVYYGSLEEVLASMARVVLAGAFLWLGEALESAFGGTNGIYMAVTNTFRTQMADAITEASNNLKALGAVINPLFTIVAITEAGITHIAGTALNEGTSPEWVQKVLAGIGAASQLLNPASLMILPFIVITMVLTVIISTMFLLASAFWPIVAGSLALPIGLGPSLFGRWLSVVVWAFIMGAIGPFVVRAGLELGVSRPAAYIASQAREIVDQTVEELKTQFRENRRIVAESIYQVSAQNGWDPTKCGYEVFIDTDGKLNWRPTQANITDQIFSARACTILTWEVRKNYIRDAGVMVVGLGKGLVDMFQAWAQTLMMTVGGMAAGLLIAGYLASLVATFFGGLGLAVTAAALGYATRTAAGAIAGLGGVGAAVGEVGRGVAGAARSAAGAAGAAGSALASAGARAVERVGGWVVDRSPSGLPPSYERTTEAPPAWMHRGGAESVPVVVRGGGTSITAGGEGSPRYTTPQASPPEAYRGGPAPVASEGWISRAAEAKPPSVQGGGPTEPTTPATGPTAPTGGTPSYEPPGRWAGRSGNWVKPPDKTDE